VEALSSLNGKPLGMHIRQDLENGPMYAGRVVCVLGHKIMHEQPIHFLNGIFEVGGNLKHFSLLFQRGGPVGPVISYIVQKKERKKLKCLKTV
jgi:hypothetical protein